MQRGKNAVKVTDWSTVDLEKLRRWFGDVNKRPHEFLTEFGIKYERIYAHRRKLNLPPRPRIWRNLTDDPTPEEIAERAADCRRRHYEQVRLYGQPEPQPSKIMCEKDTPDLTPRIFCGGIL
jgi:hypothetical protein